jgi:cell division protein FtsQ
MQPKAKKILFIVLDTLLAVYVIFAFSAFDKPRSGATVCNKVSINISDEAVNGFITTQEIKHRLQSERLYPLNREMRNVNSRTIEERLSRSAFVKTAECYKTQDGEVSIYITQRLPIIRVKAINGDDYYLDDNAQVMPNSKYTSDLIIASGYISRAYATRYLSILADVIMGSDLWRNQVEQINVTTERGIELVPRVGNHIIYIGTLPESNVKKEREKMVRKFIEEQLSRLEKFYKYGLSRAGWNKYSYINLEFSNQIICKKREIK